MAANSLFVTTQAKNIATVEKNKSSGLNGKKPKRQNTKAKINKKIKQ